MINIHDNEDEKLNSDLHESVFLQKSVDVLNIKDNGVYLDCTFGRGGHSREILERNNTVKVLAIDRDKSSLKAADSFQDFYRNRFFFVNDKFSNIHHILDLHEVKSFIAKGKFDGILIDLGISSPQIDNGEAGFSYMIDGPLNMSMDDLTNGRSAEFIINNYSIDELKWIFKIFGEERAARRIALNIQYARKKSKISTTFQLREIIKKSVGEKFLIKSCSRVFQALRIYINQEVQEIIKFLENVHSILSGYISIITFHSIEDRIVKQYFKYNILPDINEFQFKSKGKPKKNNYTIIGFENMFRHINRYIEKDPLNIRARSAILRYACI